MARVSALRLVLVAALATALAPPRVLPAVQRGRHRLAPSRASGAAYDAAEAAFWSDVRSRVGARGGARFDAFCERYREDWRADVGSGDGSARALDDDVHCPRRLESGQFVARHGGAYPGLRAERWWDAAAFPWLAPLVAAAPAIGAEAAAARGGDARLEAGSDVVVRFPLDDASHRATLEALDGDTCVVRYDDGEAEAVALSCVESASSSGWLRRARAKSPWPRALTACGFEHVALSTALATADVVAFAATRAALRAARDAGAPRSDPARPRAYGSPRLCGLSRQSARSVLPAHSDLRNWVLTAHVPLAVPAAPLDLPRAPPPSLETQAALAPRHARAPDGARRRDRATYAAALWGAGERAGAGAAGMIVDGEPRDWSEPRVFDTSFVHSAYNDAASPADYLHIDFYHPDLGPDERFALATFQKCQRRWKAARAKLQKTTPG